MTIPYRPVNSQITWHVVALVTKETKEGGTRNLHCEKPNSWGGSAEWKMIVVVRKG
jgi:hypothetical protein